jgi:hypothetical protein
MVVLKANVAEVSLSGGRLPQAEQIVFSRCIEAVW